MSIKGRQPGPGRPVKVGFVINPIAGMGGRVGLKGTDGVLDQAIALGAQPVSTARALTALRQLAVIREADAHRPTIHWIAGPGALGFDALIQTNFEVHDVLTVDGHLTGAAQTQQCVAQMVKAGAALIVFCGGDGTARDVSAITGDAVPIVGIPAGVKMFSGVFGTTPAGTAMIVARFVKGEIGTATADVLDLDEQQYRDGRFVVRLRGSAMVPREPSFTQCSKSQITSADDDSVKQDIARWLSERLSAYPDALFLLGPGSTVQALGRLLGINKSVLGVDALVNGQLIGSDLHEQAILRLLSNHPIGALVLSPIGAQGFVLGRGNQQLSPSVISRFGLDSIWIVATPAKLAVTRRLHFDTGDASLDAQFAARRFWPVTIGYQRERMVPIG